jgi:hypothetical protein
MNQRPPSDVVAARQREVAQRYARRHLPSTAKDRITSLRRKQALLLLKHRHGAKLPDNEDGCTALQVLLELGLDGPSALAIAPWAAGERLDLLWEAADENWRWWSRDHHRNGSITRRLGERLKVTWQEKRDLALHHLGAIDIDQHDVAGDQRKRRAERERQRRAHKRQQRQQPKPTGDSQGGGQGDGQGGQGNVEAPAPAATPAVAEERSFWDLHGVDARAFALAGGLLRRDHEWWPMPDLVKRAAALGAFSDLSADSLRRAVHRASDRLQAEGFAEIAFDGTRKKRVRLLRTAADVAAMQEAAQQQQEEDEWKSLDAEFSQNRDH